MNAPDLGKLLERAAALLHIEAGRAPVRFAVPVGEGGDLQCIARLVWLLHEVGFRVIVFDALTGVPLCQSLPGRPYDIDRGEEGDGAQPTTPAGPATHMPAPAFPRYMADLVERAASRLKAEDWRQSVAFTWWADGEAVPYTARIDWSPGELAPRVIVFRGRSGDFVCRSLPGKLHEIDPRTWCIDIEPDEVARYEWNEARKQRKGRKAGLP